MTAETLTYKGRMEKRERVDCNLVDGIGIAEGEDPAMYSESIPGKVKAGNQAATDALNVHLYLDGSGAANVITVLPTLSFDDLKDLVEREFGHAVVLRFVDDRKQIYLDDDDTLQRFFICHHGQELNIFCSKPKVQITTMPRPPHLSSSLEGTSDTLAEVCCEVTYLGSRVVLPRLTDAITNEAELKSAWEEWATPSGRVVNEVVAKSARTLGTMNLGFRQMPTITIFDKDNHQSVVSIAAIIELTDPTEGDTLPEVRSDAFQLLIGSLSAILDLTPGRSHVYGILTNHHYLVWMKAQRAFVENGVEYVLLHAGPFGEDFLQLILNRSLDELGVKKWEVMMNGQKHILNKHLGSGRRSIGFEHPADKKLVVKYFADRKEAAKERFICGKLRGIEGVAQLAKVQSDDPRFVAVEPKGLPFNKTNCRMTKEHVRGLRRALRAIHRMGFAHNCVRPSNLYYIDETHAVLSGWSSATKVSLWQSRHDFTSLRIAVEALGGSPQLQDFAEKRPGKRLREEDEVDDHDDDGGEDDEEDGNCFENL